MTDRTQADIVNILKRLERLEAIERPITATGSFAPTLVGAGTAGTFTYTTNATIVEWTRNANRLYYNGRIVITVITVAPVGAMTINGWPYAGVSDANMAIAGGGALIGMRGITFPAGFTWATLQFANGSANASLIRNGSNQAIASVVGADIVLVAGQLDLRFAGSYRIA